VVEAFFAAGRAGDFEALARLLDPDVVLRADFGGGRPVAVYHGAQAVASLAREPDGAKLYPALVNGAPGAVITIDGRPYSVLAFTIVNDKIAEIDGLGDPDRVRELAAAVLPRGLWPESRRCCRRATRCLTGLQSWLPPARRRGATRAPALAAARQQGMRLAQVAEQLRLGARELADPGR
jgi:hypothetical protein